LATGDFFLARLWLFLKRAHLISTVGFRLWSDGMEDTATSNVKYAHEYHDFACLLWARALRSPWGRDLDVDWCESDAYPHLVGARQICAFMATNESTDFPWCRQFHLPSSRNSGDSFLRLANIGHFRWFFHLVSSSDSTSTCVCQFCGGLGAVAELPEDIRSHLHAFLATGRPCRLRLPHIKLNCSNRVSLDGLCSSCQSFIRKVFSGWRKQNSASAAIRMVLRGWFDSEGVVRCDRHTENHILAFAGRPIMMSRLTTVFLTQHDQLLLTVKTSTRSAALSTAASSHQAATFSQLAELPGCTFIMNGRFLDAHSTADWGPPGENSSAHDA